MFQQMLRKLTMLNSIVFLILFVTFGIIVFGYMSYSIFDKIDDSMRYRATALKIVNGRIMVSPKLRPPVDPRTFLLLRTIDGQVISLSPIQSEARADVIEVAAKANAGELRNIEYDDHIYRILSVPYVYEENVLITDNAAIPIKEVLAVGIVDAEVGLLRNLLIIIVAGLVAGTTIIFLAGYFLARRALVPILTAWEKQQQFVADASHELRTPLTVIRSNAELILRHPDNTVAAESQRVTNIVRETIRMTKLIATLLTLARADANQAEIQLTAVCLNDIIETIEEQFQPMAEMKGVQLTVDSKEQLELIADRDRLHQLLVILVDNAVKYTFPPGQITLSCYRQSNNIVIRVEDTGCGIPPEDLPRVFDRFFRGDKSRSRETGGTGLGLAIAEWIVERHGGKIKVDSQVGIGTQFTIVLPIRK